jgi:predicted nucleotidyltransferase
MGNEARLFDGIFTSTQQSLLKLLFGQPDRKYGLTELIEQAGMGRGTVQRTLKKMTETGLVEVSYQHNQKLYHANHKISLFRDLSNIANQMLSGTSAAAMPEPPAQQSAGKQHHLEIAQDTLMSLVNRFHISRVAVFGTAAHSDLQPNDVIDLLVEFRTGKSPSTVGMKIVQNAFSDLFGGRKVHLAKSSILKHSFRRASIEKDMQDLYVA